MEPMFVLVGDDLITLLFATITSKTRLEWNRHVWEDLEIDGSFK